MPNIQELADQQAINIRLERLYGRHVDCDKARFRLCWTSSERVKRLGEFEDYVPGTDIYLRTVKEIRECEKYPHIPDRWAVERLIPNFYSDLMEGNYIYECLYAFPEGLPISWRAIEFLISHIFRRVKGQDDLLLKIPQTQIECDYQELERLKKEKQIIRDMIDTTPMEIYLHDKSATSVQGLKKEKSDV